MLLPALNKRFSFGTLKPLDLCKVSILSYSNKQTLLFTYSINSDNDEVMCSFPKELACSTQFGLWSKVPTKSDIIGCLSSYYKHFSLGVGDGHDDSFVVSVILSIFSSVTALGTSVSTFTNDCSI